MSYLDTPRRGARTRFDHTRRNILIGIVLVVVALLSTGVAGLIVAQGNRSQRNTTDIPRYIDMWAVYPDDTIRFMTIFHPEDNAADTLVEVAGPLVPTATDIQSQQVFGGEMANNEVLPGPGQDSAYVYPRFTIQRSPGTDPYGADVLASNAPYIIPDTFDPNARGLALGANPQTYYKQVIVAVALPDDATVTIPPNATATGAAALEPYRTTHIGGWQVYYFDTTSLPAASAIHLTYKMQSQTAPPDLDYWQVDLKH